ncbi:ThiS family protein [Pirellula sp. SH-Sr6A]|nr:ThiS family protein [Pirellula sp. SH-Sr6A]
MRILLFGGAREAADATTVEVELQLPVTIAQIAESLGAQVPGLKSYLASSRFAVNHEIVDSQFLITPDLPNLEVALIPPVSGG